MSTRRGKPRSLSSSSAELTSKSSRRRSPPASNRKTEPNPIIPWIGGKRRLADTLLKRFPAHECYVEVFAGGAALFFLRPPARVEVINDVNGELVNLYRMVQHHLEEFAGNLNGP